VVVQTDGGTVVAKGTSVGGADLVPLIAGLSLRAGQRLVAQQSMGAQSSVFTPDQLAVTVGASPTSHAQLPPMAFRSRLFQCGAAVWLVGGAPGAAVTVSVGAAVLGSGRVGATGDARIGLPSHLPHGSATVDASQTAPPGFPALTGSPQIAVGQTIPLPLGPLPAPLVVAPLPMGCESFVQIGGVIDGAEVTVTRESDGSSDTATFDLSQLQFNLSRPFPAEGDRIEVTQSLPGCEVHPSKGTIPDIRPADTPPPIDVTPPCAGSCYVHVASLRGGASLTLTVTNPSISIDALAYVVPPDRTTWDVPVTPLPAGGMVQVTLAVCGFTTSATVSIVDDAPPPPPDVEDPLYACGRAVSVKTRTGAQLELWADFGDGPAQISKRVRAHHDLETICVFPFLSVPESVWAHQLSCGGLILDSVARNTKPHPRLEALQLQEPLVEGQRAVLPTNVLSGANVTVWASSRKHGGQQEIGKRDVTQADPVVGLTRRLTNDDLVWTVQDLCGEHPDEREQRRYSVIAGEMHFVLPAPVERDSGESPGGKLIIHAAEFDCRFADGAWILFADVENTDTGYDCSTVIGASLNLPDPLRFGEMLDIDLAAAGHGLPIGLDSLGYPSRATMTKRGNYGPRQNPAFWNQVLTTTATWKTDFVAWRNYAPVGDKPDWVSGHNAPPDPNQLFPPLPTDDV